MPGDTSPIMLPSRAPSEEAHRSPAPSGEGRVKRAGKRVQNTTIGAGWPTRIPTPTPRARASRPTRSRTATAAQRASPTSKRRTRASPRSATIGRSAPRRPRASSKTSTTAWPKPLPRTT
nr:MAG TPA: hypothetical protein [Caudoviricetes sp.]